MHKHKYKAQINACTGTQTERMIFVDGAQKVIRHVECLAIEPNWYSTANAPQNNQFLELALALTRSTRQSLCVLNAMCT